jgi:uncharacterized membrane protein
MYLFHPMIVHFAVAFFVAAMATEALFILTGKRFWGLVTKYHILLAAVSALAAVITGFIDYGYIWMSEPGFRYLRAHMILGFIVFFIIQFMANYRLYMHKILPEKMRLGYLIMGGLGLGLIFGAAVIGKTAVYDQGTGVRAAMMKFTQTEEYLKKLYGLENLPAPGAADSLLALEFMPHFDDSLAIKSDTLAQAEPEHQEGELETLPDAHEHH